MPNCFQLTRKGETKPTSLAKIDEELCKHLGQAVHPTKYVAKWYIIIGFRLACGQTFDEIVKELTDYRNKGDVHAIDELRCCEYLQENFTADVWCERY